ncbi:MAG: type II secretion system major pseudopilin GspG [Hyphomicrobiaceae bacterium]
MRDSISKEPARAVAFDRDKAERRRGQSGFTLVELLVVMTILVLLAGIVAPRVMGYLGSSRLKAAKVQIESIATSLELYRLDIGRYPSSEEGLVALVRNPANVRNWNGPYLKSNSVPLDPWGISYIYRAPGRHGAFDIYSLGADGKQSGEGENQDITSW